MSRLPLVTAHAGCMDTVPNTMDSIKQAIEAGADVIEVDVRATRDGIPILMHDAFINMSHEAKQVAELTFEELKNHGDNEIVTLEEALTLAKECGKVLNLDMKSLDAIDPMVKIVQEKKMAEQIILTGCSEEKALYLQKNHQQFRFLYNVEDELFLDEAYDSEAVIKKICYEASKMSCCGINIEYKYCTKELINHAHSRFLPVAIWTVDDIHYMQKYIEQGVYSITTNKVQTLKKLLEGMDN